MSLRNRINLFMTSMRCQDYLGKSHIKGGNMFQIVIPDVLSFL